MLLLWLFNVTAQHFEYKLTDIKFNLRSYLDKEPHLNSNIVMVNLDDYSKNQSSYDLWPYKYYAETIEKINFVNSLDSVLNRNIEIFVEATGNPIVGTQHASKVIQSGKNIIMVNVEADVLCGKYLSDLAKENNVIYSMAYGDQPSLILEQIEWARLNGFFVTCAGKGTKYHPSFEYSTPKNVWDNYGITSEDIDKVLKLLKDELS